MGEICYKCRRENPEHQMRFFVVDYTVSSQTEQFGIEKKTTTTTYETLAGAARVSFCDKCIRRRRRARARRYAIVTMAILFLVFAFIVAMLMNDYCAEHPTLYFTSMAALAFVFAVKVYLKYMKQPAPFLGAALLDEAFILNNGEGKRFAPADRALYVKDNDIDKGRENFSKECGLSTDLKDRLYKDYISKENADYLVDMMIRSNPSAFMG